MTNHLRGALIGLAVGDALGAAVEFSSPGSFAPVTGYRSGGPHRLNPGEWTDDTSMALALADSIATVGWDLNDQASRYVEWWKNGKYSVNGQCFDIGITTRRALHNFLANNNALASGDASERASGNGSIMRLAPVPIAYADLYPNNIEELSRLADESSLPTHASEQCRSACQLTFKQVGPANRRANIVEMSADDGMDVVASSGREAGESLHAASLHVLGHFVVD